MRIALLLFVALVLRVGAVDVVPPADHQTDWFHYSGVLGGGGFPSTNGWTHYATIVFPGHTRADLNTAILNAPAYGIVRVTGTGGRIDGGDIRFTRSSVRIIGQGAWNKQMEFTNGNGQAAFTFNPSAFEAPPSFQRNWTAGYSRGETNITLSSVASLAVGKLLFLTQTADNEDVQGMGSEGGCDYCAGLLFGAAGSTNFIEQEQKIVQAINGNVVTIFPGIIATNWESAASPKANYFSSATLTNMWIEDLGYTNRDGSIKYLVESMNCVNYGMKKVWSQRGLLAHFKTLHTLAWTIESSMFEKTFANSTESYGIAPYNTSGGLVVDSAFNEVTGPWKATSASACAFAYNFNTNQIYANPSGSSSGTNWLVGSASAHGSFTMYTLLEGNVLNENYNDFIHGSQGWNTAFRNRIWGWQWDRTANTYAIVLEYKNRYNHAYGNVLGYHGFHTSIEALYPAVVPTPDRTIFVVGYHDTDHDTTGGDLLTVSTYGRSHNFNTLTTTNNGNVIGGGYTTNDVVPLTLLYTNGVYPRWMAGSIKAIGPDYLSRSTNFAGLQVPVVRRYVLARPNGPAGGEGDMQTFFTDLPFDGVTTATNALQNGTAIGALGGAGGL